MKALIVLLVVGAAAYFFFQQRQQQQAPLKIENPVFAEYRADIAIGSRKIEFMLFGKMANDAECRERADFVWKKLIGTCPTCTMTSATCKVQLEPRYLRLFDNEQIRSTYIAFTAANATERDGRAVFFGLTADEGNSLCETLKAEFKKQYQGEAMCVAGVNNE